MGRHPPDRPPSPTVGRARLRKRTFEENAEAVVSDTVLIWAVTPSAGAAEEQWVSGFWINAKACAIHIAADRTTVDMMRESATVMGPLWVAVVRSGAVGDHGETEPPLTADGLVEGARALGMPLVVLAHPGADERSAWAGAAVRRAFDHAGIGYALADLYPGEPIEIGMEEGQADPARWPSS